MSQRVGLFGGSFNPIHFGHLIAARSVAERIELDRVIFLPSANPPHKPKPELAPAPDRVTMTELAIDGEPLFGYSNYDITCDGPSYTINTVRHFQHQLGPSTEITWIIGADSLADLGDWYRASELVELCRIVAAARPGWEGRSLDRLTASLGEGVVERLLKDVMETPRIDISGTDIRRRCQQGRSIRFLTPQPVCDYIARHQLYKEPGRR